MPYTTVLVHADLSVHAPARIRLAAALAHAHDAHLIGAAMTGISRFVYPCDATALAHTALDGYVETLCRQAHEALAQFEALVRASGLRSYEPRLLQDDPEGGLVSLSRFCDLLVLSQTDPRTPVPGAVRDLSEYVMFSVARPVLLVPFAREYTGLAGKALVAWDGSIEASRAVRDAMPLLCQASRVMVAHFDTGEPADLAAQSPELLAWLERHGVRADLHVQRTTGDVGNALLSLAVDEDANLIVMGGYGHSRFRELILGGVTRTMLERMATPVLMSH